MTNQDFWSQHDDEWGSHAVGDASSGGNFEPIPEGRYVVRVDEVGIESNQKDGTPQLAWKFIILDGQFVGRSVKKWNRTVTPSNRKWLKQDLHTAGIDVAKFSDVPNALVRLPRLVLWISIKHNGMGDNGKPFVNTFINQLIMGADGQPVMVDQNGMVAMPDGVILPRRTEDMKLAPATQPAQPGPGQEFQPGPTGQPPQGGQPQGGGQAQTGQVQGPPPQQGGQPQGGQWGGGNQGNQGNQGQGSF